MEILKLLFRKVNQARLDCRPFPRLIKYIPKGNYNVSHISAFNYGNAGDILLPVVLRDLFNNLLGVKRWKSVSVHKYVTQKIVSKLNKTDFIIIGGGGLFLSDTNPNEVSGWQWNCDIDGVKSIEKPIIAFAIGYNRFRGQEDFKPIFKNHLNLFVDKAKFVGIRNTGSIEKLKGYLDDSLHSKLVFQPCMTTVISKIYPDFDYKTKQNIIAVNCAFDRLNMRSVNEEKLYSIARVVKHLSLKADIYYYSHMETDKKVLSYFDDLQINYKLVELSDVKSMIRYYSIPKLVIGMRGHAQMVPFGCSTPILSIISHDKMRWFLDDIHHSEWGVDVLEDDFEAKLLSQADFIYGNYEKCIEDIEHEKNRLWDITKDNINKISNLINKEI